MLKSARQSHIRRLVDEKGEISVTELNAILDVSEATIRRDLEQLADAGWVRRTHGGALRIGLAPAEPPINQRMVENAAEKEAIGRLAAGLVHDGDTIFLGSGSTVQAMVPFLRERQNLTVISNSLPVINQMARTNVELIVIGGMFRTSEQSMVGHVADQAIREFRADHAFMGIRGIAVEHGLTSDFLPEAVTDRAILGMAPDCVIVADHSKFDRVGSVFLAPITSANRVITDSAAPPGTVAELREAGVEVLTA
ncbi:MAG: DeoR/GlpR family DNA-binding transcription regulator [Candidatus Promineifilaceae bacterium]